MRSMIIGLSALAITALPSLALADGDGVLTGAAGGAVAGAVVGGPVGAAVGGVAGGVIGGAASQPRPVVVAPGPGGPPCNTPDDDDHKQQYGRERHEADDRLSRIEQRSGPKFAFEIGPAYRPSGGLRPGWGLC